ncbi:MAG: hypothetical protein IJT23_07045 [Clostridia bacterium]|nr:hypothetical protein [Clostridia bacterium]
MKALAFGEVLWDIYPESQYIGGAPLNFAAHFKKCGGESHIITAVGNDDLGDETVMEIKKNGIDTQYLCRADRETGKCLVSLDEKGIPQYNLLDNVAYDYIKTPDLNGENFELLYFGTLSLRHENNISVLKTIISSSSFREIILDVNIRAPYYCQNVVSFAFENATIVKISEEELPIVMQLLNKVTSSVEESAEIISANFERIKMIIVTMGGKGSLVYECNLRRFHKCNAEKVNVVSTVGAGDSFTAVFAAQYLKTGNIAKALESATKVSGYVVSCKEAIPIYKIEEFT